MERKPELFAGPLCTPPFCGEGVSEGTTNQLLRSSVRFEGAWVAIDAHRAIRADVELVGPRINRIVRDGNSSQSRFRTTSSAPIAKIDLKDHLLLPGLINAHDHLEFNLFPRLGRGPYVNAAAWARDIYRPDCSPVREHLAVPKSVRLWWGGVKNLLSGVTTVCHHNPYDGGVFDSSFPVRVVRSFGWAHSLEFGENIVSNFAQTPPGSPFILHLGEGTDHASQEEIFVLDRLGALDPRTIIVHGVGLTASGHALRRARGAALVWCPTSNRFTLGTTLDIREISPLDHVALGSDSALTARGDLLDEIHFVSQEPGVSTRQIYSMVTESAASILRLQDGEGTIREGGIADFIAVPQEAQSPSETLAGLNFKKIELVIVGGKPRLVSEQMAKAWPSEWLEGFERIEIEGTVRLVRAPIKWLVSEARKNLSEEISLAGKQITQ